MLRTGRRIAIDVGAKRIGVAVSDFHGILGSPLATLNAELDVESLYKQILNLVDGEVLEFYIGLPLGLSGVGTESTKMAVNFSKQFQALTDIPVLLVDERLTTTMANRQLREVGISQRDARSTIDQMAAVAILEQALEEEKNSGLRPGHLAAESDL